jgi:hypothetical protein
LISQLAGADKTAKAGQTSESVVNPALTDGRAGFFGSWKLWGSGRDVTQRASRQQYEVIMVRLKARVSSEEDGAGQLSADPGNEGMSRQQAADFLVPQWVEIEQQAEGFLLIHMYVRPVPFVHTWHATLDEAKAEARADFNIGEDEWEAVPAEACRE